MTDSDTAVPVPSTVADDDRWELVETDVDEFGREGLVAVTARRVLYGDRDLRARVRAATGRDRLWRATFVTRLTTRPPLSSRVADLAVGSVAFRQARSRFATDLADRGFTDVTETDRRRIPVGEDKARAARFDATVSTEGAAEDVTVAAWIALWDRETDMIAAGGVYPTGAPPDVADVLASPGTYRTRLVEFLRAIGT